MALQYFDVAVVFTDGRWAENETALYLAMTFPGICGIVARTKIDLGVDAGMNDEDFDQEPCLQHVERMFCEKAPEPDNSRIRFVNAPARYWEGLHGGGAFGRIDGVCEQIRRGCQAMRGSRN